MYLHTRTFQSKEMDGVRGGGYKMVSYDTYEPVVRWILFRDNPGRVISVGKFRDEKVENISKSWFN